VKKQPQAKAVNEMNQLGKARKPFVFIIDFKKQKPLILPLEKVNPASLRFDMEGFGNAATENPLPSLKNFFFEKYPLPYEEYLPIFNKVKNEILLGNSYLLNLTQPTPIVTMLTLDEIFIHCQARFKLWFDDQFVVFSPERFVKIDGNTINTYPMKGTIDANLPDAERIILQDVKERAEHFTIVDLLRNDLNQVAKRVQVKRFRFCDRIETQEGSLLQVSSEIAGELPPDWQRFIGEIIFRLLPAGSVSGAPKQKTVEIIQAAEGYDRGFYTGIFGYFDGQQLDSAVMIRFIEKQGNQLIFKSGGGITALSQACQEYQELIDKVYVPIIGNYTPGKWSTAKPNLASAAIEP
jgi:para-aminobenzoate synthetase component 1